VGYNALTANSTGDDNTAYAYGALATNTTGIRNVAIGHSALTTNSTNSYSVAVGYKALNFSTADGNTGLGYQASYTNSTGASNTAVGYQAVYANTTGGGNTGLGYGAGSTITTGAQNTCVGINAGIAEAGGGASLTTGNYNTFIGRGAHGSAAAAGQQIVIGQDIAGQADSNVTIGGSGGKIYNAYTVNATWTQTSDARLKTNVKNDSLGLSFINRLRPVTFNWKASNEIDPSLPYYNEVNQRNTTTVIHGLIAQEVKAALDAEGCATFNGWDAGNEDTIQAISREMFISPLIKAIQELTARIAALEAK
jgi:hypothetical protein